jgi:hypothetical protein
MAEPISILVQGTSFLGLAKTITSNAILKSFEVQVPRYQAAKVIDRR